MLRHLTLRNITGGAFFAALIFGWLWLAELGAVGLGWQPIGNTAQRIAQAVRP